MLVVFSFIFLATDTTIIIAFKTYNKKLPKKGNILQKTVNKLK